MDLIDSDLVVAYYLHIGTERARKLIQVIAETVVIIDYKYQSVPPPDSFRAATTAAALLRHS